MNNNKKTLLTICVIGTVLLLQIFNTQINVLLNVNKEGVGFYWIIAVQIIKYILPVIIILLIFHKPKNLLHELGLKNGFSIGVLYAFLFTLPMLIGYFILFKYNNEQSLIVNIIKALKDGFREEIFYRAFLFGQLFRHVKLGFLPAVGINAIIFGGVHLYQASSLNESIGVFAITFMGAIWFAWLYIEWNKSLWLPIFLHFFMNFYWHIFSTENTAIGGLLLNLPRAITIALSIYLTIKIVRKKGKLNINKSNILFQKNAAFNNATNV